MKLVQHLSTPQCLSSLIFKLIKRLGLAYVPYFHMFTTLLVKTFLKLLEFKLDISTLSE